MTENEKDLEHNNVERTGDVAELNAQEQLRAILGEGGSPAEDSAANGQPDEKAPSNTAENTSGESVSPPDPSVINWATRLWRNPGSPYASSGTGSYVRDGSSARKGGAGQIIRTAVITALCVIVGIVAALQFKTIASRGKTEPDAESQINQLSSTIINLNSELDSLEAERNELKNRLDLLEQSSQDEQIAALRAELNSVRTFAGLTAVKGKGIYVQVNFTERTNVNIIQNRLLLLINELRACGAQAISINGVRILAMTEIRVVSDQYISVNARQLIAPYEIYAIGDAQNLYNGISMGGSGIGYQINELSGASCKWFIQENIVISAASDEDIKTDLLNPNP